LSTSGVPSGPGNAGGLNNSVNDPSGVSNSAKLTTPAARGTNSSGTAQSSGAANARPGVTTGSGRGARKNTDAAIVEENKTIDRKVKSICRGC
jgi:hypothetical protein